eukprot:Nk52_evm6s232 gene=Nk52_evmTU6s232
MQVFQSSVQDNSSACTEDRQKTNQYTFLVGIPQQQGEVEKRQMENPNSGIGQENNNVAFSGYFVAPQNNGMYPHGANGPQLSFSQEMGHAGYGQRADYRYNQPEPVRSKSVGNAYGKEAWSTSTAPYSGNNFVEPNNGAAGRGSRKSFTTGMNHIYERRTTEGSIPAYSQQSKKDDKPNYMGHGFIQEQCFPQGKPSDEDSIASDLNPHAKAFIFAPSAQQEDSGDDSSGPHGRKTSACDINSSESMRRRRHSLDSLDFNAISVQDMPSFMRALRLHKYTETLSSAGVDFMKLLQMSEEELEAVGVTTQGARRRLLLAVQKYCEYMSIHSNRAAAVGAQPPPEPKLAENSNTKQPYAHVVQPAALTQSHSEMAELIPPPPASNGLPSASVVDWSQSGKYFGQAGPITRRDRGLVTISEKSDEEVPPKERKKSLLCRELNVPSTQYEVGTADEINELEHQMKQQEEQLLDWIDD